MADLPAVLARFDCQVSAKWLVPERLGTWLAASATGCTRPVLAGWSAPTLLARGNLGSWPSRARSHGDSRDAPVTVERFSLTVHPDYEGGRGTGGLALT
jgi:hypothetical protein